MNTNFKAFFTHFFVFAFFVVIALAYFSPVLQGKKIYQSDIVWFTGMAKEQNDFRKATNKEPYWTNSAFGGMPTYQLGANYPHNYIKKLDKIIRFLPRPADYLFLYFIGFYILLCCLKVNYKLAVVGALAFGFSTYLIIILGVGHNAKAHAIGYMPILLGGILLVFDKKYLWGFVLTSIAMALEVMANHYQITYYFMLSILILGIVFLVDAIRKKELKHYFISVGLLSIAVTLGVATNTTNLMATKEYADWSTRGKSELTINPDGSPKENTGGLSKDYITRWSYGISESLNLFVPRLFGGSDNENLGENSKSYKFLKEKGLSRRKALEFSNGLPLYWAKQPGTSGPAYIGGIIFFLFILGLFLVKGKLKWWLFSGVLMSLLLSWGKNFSALTNFMIDNMPLYDKFRAVSSIQVILELCAPVLAILALVAIFKSTTAYTKKLNALKISVIISIGIGVVLLLFKGMFDFVGRNDDRFREGLGSELLNFIRLDREAVYVSDTIRYIVYVILAAIVVWLFIKERIKENIAIIAIGVLLVFDLVNIDLRYVNKDNFVKAQQMDEPFYKTALDKKILKDSTQFRVYDKSQGLNGSRASYFYHSIGGYHAAKPAGIEELFNYQVYRGNMLSVLNMLNVKYVIKQDKEGRSTATLNPNANGNTWFIKRLIEVETADEEIFALDSLDSKNKAVVNTEMFPTINRFNFQKDSTTVIKLIDYKPNLLTYTSSNSNDGVAVFSEMYYAHGWNAYIDGELKPHFKVNHVLRALKVPAGEHSIVFKFEPEVVVLGSKITLGSSIILGMVILSGLIFSLFANKQLTQQLTN